MTEEQTEMMRRAAQNLLDLAAAGERCKPEGLRWAMGIVNQTKPLGRPLSDGAPKEN